MRMFRSRALPPQDTPLGALDRAVIGYLILPVVIFVATWLRGWLALPVLACLAWGLRPLAARVSAPVLRLSPLQIGASVGVACAWVFLGGIDHFVFANADWHVRDAVLHDLVVSAWPVGYGPAAAGQSVLRAPLAFYLPAALVGKVFGLAAAHFALLVWCATGAALFLMQILSLTSPRPRAAVVVLLVIVAFSGLDIVGCLINGGALFRREWQITDHIEWWAGAYQYSSMTTLLFWVPNHTLAAWLMVGLLYRGRGTVALIEVLPVLVASVALWSPFTALGIAPFAACSVWEDHIARRTWGALHPGVWAPALLVAIVLGAYLAAGAGNIPHGLGIAHDGDGGQALTRYVEFFCLEAGLTGAAIFAVRPASEVALALLILALLPWASIGASNDLAMRASVPSLTVMAICAALALTDTPDGRRAAKRGVLIALLVIGAVTPLQEIMRALLLPRWPINLHASVVDAFCGWRAPHYVADIGPRSLLGGMREIHAIGPIGAGGAAPTPPGSCANPALRIMSEARRPIPD